MITKEEFDKAVNELPLDLLSGRVLPSRSEEEIKQIATDLFHNRIFTSQHLNQDAHMINQVFMVLLFMKNDQIPTNLGMIYEYEDKAMPRSINGYPIFMSCHFLNTDDTEKVFSIYNKLKTSEDKVLKSK